MSQTFRVEVYQTALAAENTLLFESDVGFPLRIGRQERGRFDGVTLDGASDAASTLRADDDKSGRKLLIADPSDRAYSRRFAEAHLSGDTIEIKNTSSNQVIYTGPEQPINPGKSRFLKTPFEVTLGEKLICFSMVGQEDSKSSIRSLAPNAPPMIRGSASWRTIELPVVSLKGTQPGSKIDSERLIDLLHTVMQMLQDSPSTAEFYDNASRAIAHLLELDNCLILFNEANKPPFGSLDRLWGNWHGQSCYPLMRDDSEFAPSQKILRLAERDKTTVYEIPEERSQSLVGVGSLIASPLKNSYNEVVGIVYGDRLISASTATFTETEAAFVDLFANGISIGLARMGQERKLSEMRTRFDQFFTPSVARQLESDVTMLEPRSATVSVLFADIRGFSRISERIGPDGTIKWINSVLSTLSDCVFQFDGVVVDYIGDEIMAMWGAPLEQENHAELAVKAALRMIESLTLINQRWKEVVGEPVNIGIGINSGVAQVGNTGSEKKFKYGPLGDVVNVSSRIQGATKQLHTRLLIAGATEELLPEDVPRRKLRSVRFVNVKRAVPLYEIPTDVDDDWRKLKTEYEAGLAFYEQGELAEASGKMASIIGHWPDDRPAMMLLSDAVKYLQLGKADFDHVWQLEQK